MLQMVRQTVDETDTPRLYVRNLPDKLPKDDLKRNLYMLFATYGIIIDIVALKTPKMRGQAHVVFRDIDSSTQAMRALEGFTFFGKDMVRHAPTTQYVQRELTSARTLHTPSPNQTASPSSTVPSECPSRTSPRRSLAPSRRVPQPPCSEARPQKPCR